MRLLVFIFVAGGGVKMLNRPVSEYISALIVYNLVLSFEALLNLSEHYKASLKPINLDEGQTSCWGGPAKVFNFVYGGYNKLSQDFFVWIGFHFES